MSNGFVYRNYRQIGFSPKRMEPIASLIYEIIRRQLPCLSSGERQKNVVTDDNKTYNVVSVYRQ